VAIVGAVVPATAAAAGKHWHRQISVGSGKRAAKVDTCFTDAAGNLTARFRLTTRSSTDRAYPRITIDLAEGSHMSHSETALMPGRRKTSFSAGTWTAAGTVTITVHNQGRSKTKTLTVGALGTC
jgi:hypothetical protein